MHRHTIDPLSTALGLVAVTVGLLTAAGRADTIADNPTEGLAVVAVLVGLALIPWNRRTATRRRDSDPSAADDGDAAAVTAAHRSTNE